MSWWLIIVIAVLVLSLITYIFYPSIKKLFSHKDKPKKIKEEKKKEKPSEVKKVEVFENKDEKLFNERKFEDPDTKVNYDNFDFDGFFGNDENSLKDKKEESLSQNKIYEDNFDDFFNKHFGDKNTNKKNNFSFRGSRNGEVEDIEDLFSEKMLVEDSEVRKQFERLPDEMKALIMSDFLKRKD
jgi:hypothetical protein